MALSMKLDWRKMSDVTLTSDGSCVLRSSKARSRVSVRSSVEVEGCFVTVTSTAGAPLNDAVPRRGSLAPVAMSATCSSRTLRPVESFLTKAFPNASGWRVERSPRTTYSLP